MRAGKNKPRREFRFVSHAKNTPFFLKRFSPLAHGYYVITLYSTGSFTNLYL